ncbi:MAG: hypothetical protein ACI9GZ_002333 [Bacteroidia bacterium]|jgi:hypothetical protein
MNILKHIRVIEIKNIETSKFPRHHLHPSSEGIRQGSKKDMDVKSEGLSKRKGSLNEKDFKDDMSCDDIDISGSEVDDQ